MTTRVLTMNEKDTLEVDEALADLRHILVELRPDFGGLQEWNRERDHESRIVLRKLRYGYIRGPKGGGPVVYDADKYTLRSVRSHRLALPEFVGHLPGRRSRLGTSWATVAVLGNLRFGHEIPVVVFHLTAEVEDAKRGGYKTDWAHRLRVARHKREKRRLGKLLRRLRHLDREAFGLGDTNYSRMSLGGFTGCWDGRPGGTLDWRAVDIIYAHLPAAVVRTFPTRSDHRAVVATYP